MKVPDAILKQFIYIYKSGSFFHHIFYGKLLKKGDKVPASLQILSCRREMSHFPTLKDISRCGV